MILPSVWLYLQSFNADYWYLGLVLSAYNAVAAASAIVIGHIADSNAVNFLILGLLLNLAEIAGNTIYSLDFHVSLPLLGRIVAAIGEGYLAGMYGVLSRATSEDERTRYFSILKGAHNLGIAFGPAFNFFLEGFNFRIGHWHIDYRTSPGFFMAVTWALVAGIMYALAYDLSDEKEIETGYEPVSNEPYKQKESTKKRQLREAFGIESSGDESDQATPFHAKTADDSEKVAEKEFAKESNEAIFKNALVDIFSKFHVIVPIYSLFLTNILLASLRAVAPLVAEHTLNWRESSVTVLFTLWGLEIVTVIFILWFLSRKISDRLVLLMSAIFGSLSSTSVFLLAVFPDQGFSLILPIVFQGISHAAIAVVGRSLVSKHTDSRNQATIQAIVTASNRVSHAVGPLIGSSLFTHEKILATILTGSEILGLVLVILAFKKYKC